eukprot:TRINITY_DN3889_c0_g2_i3.p1 TRINITY_DN3889_c0_g2~~TRINITY_DN3889_c0_g2_i3.p1  ORF type:complete len:193 (-),score=20.82 TRINITY_DN3889_c0_g2_i3:33-551(-)
MCIRDSFYWVYIIAQILGALTGGLIAAMCNISIPLLSPNSDGYAFILESFFTMILCLTVCVLCDEKLSRSNPFIAAANVGGCLFLTGETIGPVTGAVVNPSIALGIMSSKALTQDYSFHPFKHGALYLIAPFVGATLAHLIYWFIFREPKGRKPRISDVSESFLNKSDSQTV